MRKFRKFLTLTLGMIMLMSVFSTGASAYFPYINNGGVSDVISNDYQITSFNVTDLYGTNLESLAAGESALVSCRIKSLDSNGTAMLIAAAFSGDRMVTVNYSDTVTLDENAKDMGVYLTAPVSVDSFKAFIWDGFSNLIPLTKSADTASETVNVDGIIFNGETIDVNDFTADGTVFTYNETITIPVYQLETPSVQILTDNPAARVEVIVNDNKTFPLIKQQAFGAEVSYGTATITATVSLNGDAVKTYEFNVIQYAPEITDAKFYEWQSGPSTNMIYYKPQDASMYNVSDDSKAADGALAFSLEKIKEADYTTVDYKRSELAASTATTSAPEGGVYLNFDTSGNDANYMMVNIPEEFVNGVLLKSVTRTAGSTRSLSTYSLSYKSSASGVSAESDLIPSTTFQSYTFDLNRSATVYVYNRPDTSSNSVTANVQTFINEGFVRRTDINLPYYNFGSSSYLGRSSHWYTKHIDVTGNAPVHVSIPVGSYMVYVVVKFDECSFATSNDQKVSVATDVTYTLGDDVTASTTLRLFEPIPMDDDLVFAEEDDRSYNNYIYKVQPWTNKNYILSGIDEAVLGGEVIKLPNDPANLKSVSFTLLESADVYFIVNCKASTAQEDWMAVKPDWFEDGWRLLPQSVSPVDKMLYVNPSGKGKEYTGWGDTGNETVKKHFEVNGSPVSVTLNLTAFQGNDKFASTSSGNNAERAMLVIIKKTER